MITPIPNPTDYTLVDMGTYELLLYKLALFETSYRCEQLGIPLPPSFSLEELARHINQDSRNIYIRDHMDPQTLEFFEAKIINIVKDDDTYLQFDPVVIWQQISGEVVSYEAFFYIEPKSKHFAVFNSNSSVYLTAGSFVGRTEEFDILTNSGFYFARKFL